MRIQKALNILSSFFHDFLNNIQQAMKEKTEKIVQRFMRMVAIILTEIIFLLLGLFNLSVGIIKYFSVWFLEMKQ